MNKPRPILREGQSVMPPPSPRPSTNLPGIDNAQVIPSYPDTRKENSSKLVSYDRYGRPVRPKGYNKPRDKHGRFKKGSRHHRMTMRAVLWATAGFLAGVIFEMFAQLITR